MYVRVDEDSAPEKKAVDELKDETMGCFDSVMVPCPKCGVKREFQTKSGPCELKVYELHEAPADVMDDVNRHAPTSCECGTFFMVDFPDGKPLPTEVSKPARNYKQDLEAAEAGLMATQERCDGWRVKAEGWEAAYWALIKAVRG